MQIIISRQRPLAAFVLGILVVSLSPSLSLAGAWAAKPGAESGYVVVKLKSPAAVYYRGGNTGYTGYVEERKTV